MCAEHEMHGMYNIKVVKNLSLQAMYLARFKLVMSQAQIRSHCLRQRAQLN